MDSAVILAAGALLAGLVAAIVGATKAPSEKATLLIEGSANLVVAQSSVIEELRQGLADAKRRIDELEPLADEVQALRSEVVNLRSENQHLRIENTALKERMLHLEKGES